MKRSPIKNAAAIILAGGKSSRLFPFNKVLSDLTGSGRTLIQQTQDRLGSFPKNAIYVLTTSDMVAPVQRQLQLSASHILVDPVRRGTWPAILWAMAHLRRTNPSTVLGILPGDHAIQNSGAFKEALTQAVEWARAKPAVVMIGISPNANPEEWRGLGCFRADHQGRITQFQEKPGDAEIRRMVDEGDWCWNSGMFFFRISTAELALQTYQPDMHNTYTALATAVAKGKKTDAASLFRNFPDKIPHPLEPGRWVDNSMDYAMMTSLVSRPVSGLEARAVREVGFRWTDLGQWSALKNVVKVDSRGNIRIGDIKVGPDVRESILVADRGNRIEVAEADAMIIAFSGKRALVVPVSQVARVKEMVAASKDGRAIVGAMPQAASFVLRKRGNVSILSNRSKEAL
jgi:mannose-1-phosphate guanylyltransferase